MSMVCVRMGRKRERERERGEWGGKEGESLGSVVEDEPSELVAALEREGGGEREREREGRVRERES